MWHHQAGACSDDKTRLNLDFDSFYCMELEALSPVKQGSFNGVRVCGERNGATFYELVRVDSTGQCPEGTESCTANTSPENTVCYPPADLKAFCPITSFDIIGSLKEVGYKVQGYDLLELDNEHSIVYSKTSDSMATTSIRVEHEPCLVQENASAASGTVSLPNELLQTDTCPPDLNTGLSIDERYIEASDWEFSEG